MIVPTFRGDQPRLGSVKEWVGAPRIMHPNHNWDALPNTDRKGTHEGCPDGTDARWNYAFGAGLSRIAWTTVLALSRKLFDGVSLPVHKGMSASCIVFR